MLYDGARLPAARRRLHADRTEHRSGSQPRTRGTGISYHAICPDVARKRAEFGCGGICENGRRGREELPGFQGSQRADHAGCQTRVSSRQANPPAYGTFAFEGDCVVKRPRSARPELSTPARMSTEATGEQTASSERVELVVPALRHPIRFCLVAPTVQQGRAFPWRNSILLLVPASVGNHRRNFDGHRLLRNGSQAHLSGILAAKLGR